MKYLPIFPERFGSLADARAFMDRFATAYNHEHRRTESSSRSSWSMRAILPEQG